MNDEYECIYDNMNKKWKRIQKTLKKIDIIIIFSKKNNNNNDDDDIKFANHKINFFFYHKYNYDDINK